MVTSEPLASGHEPPRQSRPRQVADYLRGLRLILAQTTQARQSFIRGTGALMEAVRRNEANDFVKVADGIAFEANATFRSVREQLNEMDPPPACEGCHEAVTAWVEMLIASADTVSEAGKANQPARLREVQGMIAESRVFSARFKTQYDGLVEQLRARNTDRAKTQKLKRKLSGGSASPS